MKTARIIVIACLMLIVATSAMAAQTAKVSYMQDWNWHGFKIFGDDYVHPAIAISVKGIDIEAITHLGNAHDDIEHWDTKAGITLPSLAAGLQIKAGYGYLIMPGMDAQEFGLTVQLPGAIAPRYTIAYVELDTGDSGQFHVAGIDVTLGEPDKLAAVLSAEVTYNDGVFGIEDWTHATAGIVLDVPVGSVGVQPGCWYQYTMEPEALNCEESEVWYGIGVIYKF